MVFVFLKQHCWHKILVKVSKHEECCLLELLKARTDQDVKAVLVDVFVHVDCAGKESVCKAVQHGFLQASYLVVLRSFYCVMCLYVSVELATEFHNLIPCHLDYLANQELLLNNDFVVWNGSSNERKKVDVSIRPQLDLMS